VSSRQGSDADLSAVLKRLLLGRQLSSHASEHQLLPKILALPVFSSDPLSSVAYATEEMMLVLVLAGAAALSFKVPLALGVGALLLIVVTSYRQTVKAYPRGGGSYIVARENLGILPGLTAAAAILTDYVLTVSVSVTAGTVAIVSAAPSLNEHRVPIAIALVLFVATMNLRGVKEAGTLFAIPTYGFVAVVAVTIVVGFVRCLGGCPQAPTANLPVQGEAAITAFLLARAFSSGATALTGVEAIADGVQAFRRPQAKNAASTLLMMGVMAVSMFLGITLLAEVLGVRIDEEIAATNSVLSQIGATVFGQGSAGFYLLQIFTAGILILAANTAFQDFPRLSSILARDRFMPSQFRNRGDRLVFSNGVVVLTALASLLIWAFHAELSRLIQLYVVGVFTAFTLSQAGMVRRWMRLKGERWQRKAVINGIGAATTGLVLVVVTLTKFSRGAWIVIVAMPFIILFFWSVHRHYKRVAHRLGWDPHAHGVGRNIVVLLVKDFDAAEAESLGYVRSFRVAEVHVATPGREITPDMRERWRRFAGESAPELEALGGGGLFVSVRRYVRDLRAGPDDFVTVVLGEMIRGGLLTYLLRRRELVRLKAGLLRVPHVVIADVPVVVRGGRPVGVDARPLIPGRTVTLVFVSSLSAATARAVAYARSLGASEARALYFDLDPQEASALGREWFEAELDVPLDIVEAPFRELGPPIIEEVRRYTSRPDTVVNVILPELVLTHWWELALHNQTALFVKRLLLFEERVILSSVPYPLEAAQEALGATH
jgi:amino acid transporter